MHRVHELWPHVPMQTQDKSCIRTCGRAAIRAVSEKRWFCNCVSQKGSGKDCLSLKCEEYGADVTNAIMTRWCLLE